MIHLCRILVYKFTIFKFLTTNLKKFQYIVLLIFKINVEKITLKKTKSKQNFIIFNDNIGIFCNIFKFILLQN